MIEIWQFIAGDNELAADRMLDKFENALLMLADHPEAGRARPELAPAIRSFPVGNYILFYRHRAEGVELVRVRNGYLDIRADNLE